MSHLYCKLNGHGMGHGMAAAWYFHSRGAWGTCQVRMCWVRSLMTHDFIRLPPPPPPSLEPPARCVARGPCCPAPLGCMCAGCRQQEAQSQCLLLHCRGKGRELRRHTCSAWVMGDGHGLSFPDTPCSQCPAAPAPGEGSGNL